MKASKCIIANESLHFFFFSCFPDSERLPRPWGALLELERVVEVIDALVVAQEHGGQGD